MRQGRGSFWAFISVLVWCGCIFLPASATAQARPAFGVTEVGPELGFLPSDLGNNGAVVGSTYVEIPDGPWVYAASVWYEGATTILDLATTVPEQDLEMFSWAKAISDDGHIVGAIFDLGDQPGRLFLVEPDGTIVDLFLSGLIDFRFKWYEFDMAINNLGQIVVHNFPSGGSGYHPYLINPVNNEYEVLPLIPEIAFRGEVLALNNFGEMVGFYEVPPTYSPMRHPFFRTAAGVPLPVGDPAGPGDYAVVAALNDVARVVGSAGIGDIGQTEAFISVAPGPLVSLGTLGGWSSSANAINNSGWIVGASSISKFDSVEHAFLEIDGAMYDLNDLVPPDLPWELVEALDVNDSGQILVFAEPMDPGSGRYLLLTPLNGEIVDEFIELIISYDLPRGLENSLIKKLEHAREAIREGDLTRACNLLGAFTNQVNAQTGKKLTETQAGEILEAVDTIRTELRCP